MAYNSLLLKRRTEIHEKIGKAIEEIHAERLEEFYEMLAYHYSKSENSDKAYQYLKLSGNKSIRNYSNAEAYRFYKQAINLLGGMTETEKNKREQIEVCLLVAGPMFLLGFPEDSFELLQEGERLSRELGDERSLAHFLSLIGPYHVFKRGDLLLGIQYSEEAFKEAEKIHDIELMAPIALDLCVSSFFTGENIMSVIDLASKVIALLEKTQRESESFGRPWNVYCALHARYGANMCSLGSFEKGKVLFEKGLNFALKIKDLHALSLLETHYGINLNWRGDGKNAIEHLRKAIGYCEEGQNLAYVGPAWIGLGWAYSLTGETDTAREHIEKGLKIQNEVGVRYHLSLYNGLLSMVHLDAGDLENAQHCCEEALKLSQKTHEKWPEGFMWILLGRIFGKAGKSRYDEAEECLFQGVRILDKLKIKPIYAEGCLFLGELYAEADRQDQALEYLKKAGEMFREMGMDYWLAKTQDVLERL